MSEQIDRDYTDIYSVKDLVANELVPRYFPDIEASNLTTGTIGLMSELVGTITEDSFNTGSSLVTEAFPTRAKMDSSIYSNAAIFQLSNTFAEAASCKVILGIPEEDIRKNFQRKQGSDYYYFYIDKNTSIEVEGIPFTLDYDIEIKATYRESEKGWIYSAKYIIGKYKNSISNIIDPYIRLKKMKNGLVILYVTVKQYNRTIEYESIVDNATLNSPTIDINYNGKLLGFDVLYKNPTDSGYNTQLLTKVIYSPPSKDPFVYYKSLNDNRIQLSFTTKDAYFQPAFNSEIEIVIYTTLGEDGNFKGYDGKEVLCLKGDAYDYENSWMLVAKLLSPAAGGKERMTIEGLQQLTVENYSTATSLTTEHDLQLYFNNFKYKYNNQILFLKKRNDAVELLFSAFMFIKKDDFIYPTNTLNIDTNILEFNYKDGGIYNLDPGYLFGYKQSDAFYIPVYYIIACGDGEKYDEYGHYYNASGELQPSGDISVAQLKRRTAIGSLIATDSSYWARNGLNDKWILKKSNGEVIEDAGEKIESDLLSMMKNGEVRYGTYESSAKLVDFIKDEQKEIEAKLAYFDNYEKYKEDHNKPEMTYDEYEFEYTFKDYKKDNKIDNRLRVFDVDFENTPYKKDFMFTNPFIMTITKDTGLISFYQTFISQDSVLDFVKQNDDDAFTQFITYTLHVDRDISKEKIYNLKLVVTPSVTQEKENPYCNIIYDETKRDQFILSDDNELPSFNKFNKELLKENRLRMILSFKSDDSTCAYYELIPTSYTEEGDQFIFEGNIETDDYITTDNKFRVIHTCPYCGTKILNSTNYYNDNRKYQCSHCKKYFNEGLINVREIDSLLLPTNNLEVTVTALFRDPSRDLSPITNNQFVQYDETYNNYIWTNIYNSVTEPLTMIQPLDMIRSNIKYKDFYLDGVDALDCTISSIPLLKYSILAYKDEGMSVTDPLLSDDIGKFQYFMDSFLENYQILQQERQYLGGMNIDAKFYNTYGKSTNFVIGDNDEPIDTNNISIYFDVWLIAGADQIDVDKNLKIFIKDYIETINTEGSNNLYISNLIREIEENFAQVHHLKFKGINKYDTTYQSIENNYISLEDLTKDERRNFVPDILVINKNNINLEYYQDEV